MADDFNKKPKPPVDPPSTGDEKLDDIYLALIQIYFWLRSYLRLKACLTLVSVEYVKSEHQLLGYTKRWPESKGTEWQLVLGVASHGLCLS